MTAIRLLTAAAAISMVATTAFAAAAAPAPATPPAPPPGPAIPGVCVFSAEGAIAQSSVGKAFQARMQQLQQQAEAELQPERAQLQTDAQALQAQQGSLAPDVYQQRAQAMNQRIQTYQQKAEQRSQELEATQQKNLGRIAAEVQPLLVSVYTTKKCSMVMNAEGVIGVNPSMDISPDVTTQLNGKMSTITFDREHLDQAPPSSAAAPRPAAAPAAPRR